MARFLKRGERVRLDDEQGRHGRHGGQGARARYRRARTLAASLTQREGAVTIPSEAACRQCLVGGRFPLRPRGFTLDDSRVRLDDKIPSKAACCREAPRCEAPRCAWPDDRAHDDGTANRRRRLLRTRRLPPPPATLPRATRRRPPALLRAPRPTAASRRRRSRRPGPAAAALRCAPSAEPARPRAGADGASRPPGGAAYPTCPISRLRGRRPADADRPPAAV